MDQRPTRADVARRAGVSKTTVTYVLGNRRDIAIPEATREHVRSIAEQLGYRPNPAAQALASGRTNTVTVAFPSSLGAHYAHFLQRFERESTLHGYHMVASTIGHAGLENVGPDLASLVANLSDGIVLIDMPAAFRPYLDKELPKDKAVVSVGAFTVPSTDTVEVNLESGANDAMAHLLASNPKRIAFFGPGIHDESQVLETFAAQGELDPRAFAYCRAMKESGRPIEIISGNPGSRRDSMQALRRYIDECGSPDALFCLNDEIAIGANRALREAGLRVPHDVLLIGCDGTEEGEYMNPALSTVAQPIDRMCSQAWELLINRLNDPDLPRQSVRFDAEFICRASSSRS